MNWFRTFLHFSPSEKRGLLVLFSLLIILLIVRSLPDKKFEYDVNYFLSQGDTTLKLKLEELKEHSVLANSKHQVSATFDPNYLSAKQMYQMGFPREWLDRVFTFKKKNGFIKNKEDLITICKGDSAMLQLFLNKVKFKNQKKILKDWVPPSEGPSNFLPPKKIDLNKARPEDLLILNGIGPVLSKRIIKFRNALGGFHSLGQLYQIYGLDSSVILTIKESLTVNIKIDSLKINEIGFGDLVKHPYVTKSLANGILNYREEHGPYQSFSDLSRLRLWNP